MLVEKKIPLKLLTGIASVEGVCEILEVDCYVSLNEMYLCELVHVFKINKAKLERCQEIKVSPPLPRHVTTFLNHTHSSRTPSWGL